MPDTLALLDIAAHARWHGGSSCGYNCGWNMLSGLAGFLLLALGYGAMKLSLDGAGESGFVSFLFIVAAVLFCIGLLVAVIFLGAIIVVAGIAAILGLFYWWLFTRKSA